MTFGVRILALMAALGTGLVSTAQPPADKGRTVDSLPLPPGTVIFVTPDPRAANPNVDAVILTPEEYRKLLDSANQLQNMSALGGRIIPAVCRLEVRYESETQNARIIARYQFRTESPRAIVQLGLQKSRPVSAKFENDQLPALTPTSDGGFQVVADKAGEYRLTVEALTSVQLLKGNAQQLDVGLPGAAITILEKTELPPDALRLRINGQPVAATKSGTAIVLGPVNNLAASWENSPIVKPGEAVVAVESRIEVRLEERQLVTRGRLNVSVLRGQVGEFQLTAPANAKVTTPDAKNTTIEPPTESRRTTWILKRAASADDLNIEIVLPQPLTRRPLIAYGFPLAGAAAQRGEMTFKIPDSYRLSVTPRLEMPRREPAARNGGDRTDRYEFATIPANGILADLELQPARGEIEASYAHSLQLTDNAWRLSTRVEIRPIRRELDRFELQVPAELRDIRIGPADLVEVFGPLVDAGNGLKTMSLRLTEPTRKSVSLVIDGTYSIANGVGAAGLTLPRCLETVDRGGTVQIATAPGIEVRGEVRAWDRDRVGDWQYPLEPVRDGHWNATLEHAPVRVDLTWYQSGTDSMVQSTIDIEFDARNGNVRQTLRFPLTARQFILRGPSELIERLSVVEGGILTASSAGEWVGRPASPAGRDATFIISYSFPYDPTATTNLPLLWLEGSNRCETDVRLWSAPGAAGPQLPVVESKQWIEVAPPVVKEHPRLPALAVRTTALKLPLVIRFGETTPNLPVAIIERTWIRALVDEVGAVTLRTRFLARPVRNEPLAIRLPGPPMLVRPGVRLNGRAMDVKFQDQQFLIPLGPPGTEHVIEVFCTLPARSGWSVRLDPPRPVGPIIMGGVRWQIHGPDGDAGFETSGVLTPIVRWAWHRGMLAPTPGISDSAMVRWFAGDQAQISVEPFDAAVTAISTGLPTVWISYWPRTAIIVAASLFMLAVGGLLLMVRWTVRRCSLLLVGLVGVFLVYCTWPQVVGQLFAFAQPGLWVLIPAGLIGAYVRRRSMRRSVFAPLRIVIPQGPTVIAKTAV